MKKFFLAALISVGTSVFADELVLGYNEAWFGQNYGSDMTSNFDEVYVDKVLGDMQTYGASVVRLWLFENREGIILNQHAPQSSGIDPRMITNLTRVLELSRARGLKIYVTLFDGNDMPDGNSEKRDYYFNLLNAKYGENWAFYNNVLTPVLQLLNSYQDVVYGLDLMNEIQGPMNRSYFGFWNRREGARRWMKEARDFVKQQASWIRVTSSSGWGSGASDMRDGLFSDLGFDFYDLHLYDNNGNISFVYDICRKVRSEGIPIVLGEFGQSSKTNDESLQRYAIENFLKNAKSNCFSAALPWRFDAAEEYFRFQRADGSVTPAAEVMRAFNLR